MKRVILLIFLIPFIFACTEEEISIDETAISEEASGIKGKDIAFRTHCDIIGASCGTPGGTAQFTYTKNFNTSNITWSVQSGNITIIGGQGTSTVTVSFGSNFSGGSITALGTGANGIVCSDVHSLSVCDPCTPPTYMTLSQTSGECHGDVFTFYANPNGSTDSGSYTWSAFQGATIVSGQGTQTVSIQSPSSGGFSVSVSHVNACQNTTLTAFTLAEFSAGCGGGGFGGF